MVHRILALVSLRGAWMALALALAALLPAARAEAQCIMPPGQQQTQPCTDAEAPYGSVSPGTDAFGQPSVPVTITWMDESPTSVAWIKWNGAVVTSAFEVRTWHAPVPDSDLGEHGRATGTVVVTAGQPNTLEARVCDQAVQGNPGGRCSTWTATYSLAPQPGVEVTPRSGFASVTASGSAGTQAFTVRNTGGSTATFTLAATCRDGSDGQPLSTCSLSNGSVSVAAGGTQTVTLSYSRPTAGRVLLLQVRAAHAGAPGVQDAGWVDVTVEGVGTSWLSPVVSVVDLNSGTQIERSQCVTVSAGPGAAYECGDLRLAHALPTVTTKGKARTPVLLYNSQHAHPRPTVYADVALPSNALPPEWVQAVVTVNGVQHSRSFAGADWRPGTTRRIAVQWDGSAMQTGVYAYTLQVTSHYGGGPAPAAPVSGELAVVNRGPGVPGPGVGPGWGVAGVEQLIWLGGGTRALWVGGDGSTRLYQTVGTGVLVAPSVSRPDTLRLATVQGQTHAYRRLPGGAQVWFDNAGRHVRTVNAIGDATHFAYDAAGRLLQIQVPRPDGGTASYDFAGRDALDRLHWIALTLNGAHARVTWLDFFGTDPGVDLIHDPDGQHVHFWYTDTQNPYRVTDRRERGATVQVGYGYDATGKLSWARTYMGTTAAHGDIVTGFEAAEARGVAHSSAMFASVAVSQAYTRLDGPRTDVADHTWLWVGRWGAPVRIRDAAGGETVITRGDTRFPALATEMVAPSGLRTLAAYDGRGRVDSVAVVSPLGTAANAVTRYTWDNTWDKPLSVTSYSVTGGVRTQLADPVETAYDANTGNTLWTQQGGSTRRTTFQYYTSGAAAGLLWKVTQPANTQGQAATDSLVYDAWGNLRMTRSPTGALTLIYRDGLGRDTLTITPTAAATAGDTMALRGSAGVRQRTEYDVMDRPRVSETIGPALAQAPSTASDGYTPAATPQEKLRVETEYDAAGRVKTVTRQATPDYSVGVVDTWYEYDAAGRKVKEYGSGDFPQEWTYDPAGNVLSVSSGQRRPATMQYDALGRLVRRLVPDTTYALQYDRLGLLQHHADVPFPRFPNGVNGSYVIPAEETFFRYDAAGNQVYAQNNDAIVRRSYYPNGALRGDTLQLRDYGTPEYSTSYGLQYTYDLAGRVTGMKHPENLAPGQWEHYGYHPGTGALSQLTARQGESFGFQYDNLGRPTAMQMPGSMVDSAGYDVEGRRTWHRVRGPGFMSMSETMQYDARGKLVRAESWRPAMGTGVHQQWYSGIGNLVATDWYADGTNYRATEEYVIDALGNVVRTKTGSVDVPMWAYNNHPRYKAYEPGKARVTTMAVVPPSGQTFNQDSTAQTYDRAGNLAEIYRVARESAAGSESQTRHFYGMDDRLRAVQRLSVRKPDGGAVRFSGVWEEYRYDPLGRRILVRTRTDGGLCDVDAWTCTGSITRFVWAGDQILWELKAPGNLGADLEAVTSTGAAYGQVSYTHAGGIDRPLLITKNGVSVVPHQNWRGMFAEGTNPAGQLPVPDIDWPGYHTTPWHGATRVVENWFGSLSTGMRDASGQMYMRNRYYDPASGQFTQPDPIGLAGGLNSYGFATGDPVTYRDPYGLSSCRDKKKKDEECDDDRGADGIVERHGRCEVAVMLSSYAAAVGRSPGSFAKRSSFPSEFDWKFGPTADDLFQVGNQWIRADEFGNYAAGYAGQKAGGWLGHLGVRTVGIMYASAPESDEHWSDLESAPMINAGAARARLEATNDGRTSYTRDYGVTRRPYVEPLTSTRGCN
jgi:RHS repeat-associated protein